MQLKLNRFTRLKLFKYQAMLAIATIFSLLGTAFLFKVHIANNNRTTTWRNAKEIAPPLLIKKVLSLNPIARIDDKSLKVMQIPSQGAGDLYIFDLRSPQLCGIGGCLYLIYHESGKLLLPLIANPNLPPKEELMRASNTITGKFPCLVVTQPTLNENILSRTKYCYQNQKFIRFNEEFFSSK
ncbi:hypothetical protein NIES22_71940 (plasmid) [Calothrix brevissima NIES-22]|nr:hypothetical protein NIES22_71940 [Calothrix brevissima NIES-22]